VADRESLFYSIQSSVKIEIGRLIDCLKLDRMMEEPNGHRLFGTAWQSWEEGLRPGRTKA